MGSSEYIEKGLASLRQYELIQGKLGQIAQVGGEDQRGAEVVEFTSTGEPTLAVVDGELLSYQEGLVVAAHNYLASVGVDVTSPRTFRKIRIKYKKPIIIGK